MAAEISIQQWFDARSGGRDVFLSAAGWAGCRLVPVGEDCAFRRYFRLVRGTSSVVLMESAPDGSPFATPGHRVGDYIRISAYLRGLGLHAPQVFAADEANGYLLIEDFGDTSFKIAMQAGTPPQDLYALATDILGELHRRGRPGDIILPSYYDSHVHKGRCRVVDWYMPALRGRANEDGLTQSYLNKWDEIEARQPPVPVGFLHIDYHFENLMWLPHAPAHTDRAGILDFQGAMWGPAPYDLANLLEDARVDVPPARRDEMLARFCAGMKRDEKETFLIWYRILATQFHCRVAGQFIKLALAGGKPRYLSYLPRVAAYIEAGLRDPVLAPLAEWFRDQGMDFSKTLPDVKEAGQFIRPDAF